MKNSQKGFVVPLLLAIIALLVVGGGVYIYETKKVETPTVVVNTQTVTATPTSQNETAPVSTIVASSTSATISVPGMTQYTDSNFGFSFWYPSTWMVTQDNPVTTHSWVQTKGGTLSNILYVGLGNTGGVEIEEVNSPSMTITDTGSGTPAGNGNPAITYFFDPSQHTWMVDNSGLNTRTADVSNNTMGGLHMFFGPSRFNTSIIPLSAEHFLVVSDGGGVNATDLAKTIVATDPSVAIPVSAAEQTQTIQSEMTAYTQ